MLPLLILGASATASLLFARHAKLNLTTQKTALANAIAATKPQPVLAVNTYGGKLTQAQYAALLLVQPGATTLSADQVAAAAIALVATGQYTAAQAASQIAATTSGGITASARAIPGVRPLMTN